MKIRKDKDVLRFFGISLVSILLGAAMLMFKAVFGAAAFFGGGLVLAGVIMFVMALCASMKPKTDLVVDERVARINEKAGYSAFWIVLLAVTILYWADKLWSLSVELKDIYSTVLFVGMFSWIILRWHYNKGSVI